MLPVLLLVRDLAHGKQRLASVLMQGERSVLIRAMLNDMLTALIEHPQITDVYLLSGDPQVEQVARLHRVRFLSEHSLNVSGLNESVQAAVSFLGRQGVRELMVLHSDIPLINEDSISDILSAHQKAKPRAITLVPDRHGRGSNCIVSNTDGRFVFSFGDNSAQRHRIHAVDSGATFCRVLSETVGSDVDTPKDILHLDCLKGRSDPGETLRFLRSAGIIRRVRNTESKWSEPTNSFPRNHQKESSLDILGNCKG